MMRRAAFAILAAVTSLPAQYSAIFGGGPLYSNSSTVIPQMKASGFSTVIFWSVHVHANGDLVLNDKKIVAGGKYVGRASWPADVATLKKPPSTVDRIEFSVGSWGVKDFENIEALIKAQGIGPTSILYRNFKALKDTLSDIDAIDYDDESNYDVASTVLFSKMLVGLGYKITLVPYTRSSFWKAVYDQVNAAHPGTVDRVYLQCYAGGSRNNPRSWNGLFKGIDVGPGLWCKHGSSCRSGDSPADFARRMTAWERSPGIAGGFLWLLDDVLRCQRSYPLASYAKAINDAVGVGAAATYGSGCGRGRILAVGVPSRGNSAFRVDLVGAQARTPCALMFSTGAAAIPLDVFGMRGCVGLVDPSVTFFIVGGQTDGRGEHRFPIAIPANATGGLRMQYLFREAGLNPAGAGTTRGLHVVLP